LPSSNFYLSSLLMFSEMCLSTGHQKREANLNRKMYFFLAYFGFAEGAHLQGYRYLSSNTLSSVFLRYVSQTYCLRRWLRHFFLKQLPLVVVERTHLSFLEITSGRLCSSHLGLCSFGSLMHHVPNPALNPVRFALWTLRDKPAQRRLALR